ncbi:MAG: hypothetical protein R6V46_00355 [Desulfatiglandaceae bacterium]|jgi:hypothetical protein
MTSKHALGFKKVRGWALIIICGLVAAFLGFFSVASVWIGFIHTDQVGFWVPILAGTLCLGLVFWLVFRIAKRILGDLDEEDVVNF